MHETTRQTFLIDAQDYLQVVEQIDETKMKEAYIGHWSSRDAFGQHLLADTNADRVMAEVPLWLRPYIRLDGAALVADLERDGIYTVAEISRGVCVFDGPIAKTWPRQNPIVDRQ